MKNKLIPVIQVLMFLAFTFFAKAQEEKKPISLIDKDLTFSSVRNGFTYELKMPEAVDFYTYTGISAIVANNGEDLFRLEGCINGNLWVNSAIYLEPGETKTLEIALQRRIENVPAVFQRMRGLPGGTIRFVPVNPAKFEKLEFTVYTKGNATFTISEIKPFGEFILPQKFTESPGYFPFMDKLGQYKHKDWPGKVKNESELSKSGENEQRTLRLLPGPTGRNQFGGWEDGPKLKATGSFRAEKIDGKWWLIDPDGCLFWSHGITCVAFNNGVTSVSGRKNVFEELPVFNGPMSAFYLKSRTDTIFDFSAANLYRKYGADWKEKATENIMKRLKSWGLNSFGNWSDPEIYLSSVNRIPYTVAVNPGWPGIDGKEYSGHPFPNVFEPGFRESVKAALKKLDPRIKNDPYCIGFFIDNELAVNGLTRRVIIQPASHKARLSFFEYLRNKYSSIEKLNNLWQTSYKTWQELESVTSLPGGAEADIQYFDLKIIDIYYKTCSEELKQAVPGKIYFGSRLHCLYFPEDQGEVEIIKIASQYCDVVCFNRYRYSAEELILPFGIDKPTIIGEFHYGASDRGVAQGWRGVADQNQRAEAYFHYVEGALRNPQIVGTHWFQYSDQAYTGRFDGENLQIGFVDICDNPYPEIIAAARKIGYQIYKFRYGKKPGPIL